MGKISNYTQVSASKLADKLVCDQEDGGVTSTKSVSIEQIGNAVNALQVRSDLDTQAQTIVSAINEIASYTPVYGNTASGAIATFDTSLALPLQDCTIAINAVQEAGTPTPSSPKLISGFTGANIVDCGGDNTLATYIRGIYQGIYGFVDLGSLTWTYDAESVPSNPYFFCQRDTVKVSTQNLLCSIYQLANVGVANMPDMSMKSNNKGQVLIVNHNYTDAATFKTAMSGVYLIYELETPTTPSITQAQLTAICASFNTSGTTYPITWQSEAGTVYGGYIRIVNGIVKLVVTFAGVDMSTFNWYYNTPNTRWYTTDLKDIAVLSSSNPSFKAEQWNPHAWTGRADGDIACDNSGNIVCETNDNVNSPAGLIIYELKTHVEYTLASIPPIYTLNGKNNIFGDTNGDTSVVYACSLKDYIDRQ